MGGRGSYIGYFLLLPALVLCLAFLAGTAIGAQGFCDPSLPQPLDNPQGYRMRGDRCEGIYIQEVGATVLHLASFTESFEDFDPASGTALTVEWDRPACDGDIHLRGEGLRRRLYYRMDTLRPTATSAYSWPLGILSAQQLGKGDIGLMAWTHCGSGANERDVSIPVRIRQKQNPPRSGSYQLILIPGVELAEVYMSLAQAGADGRPKAFLKNREALGYGYYPAEWKIEIPISGLKAPGLYYLSLAATLRSGGASTTELWFYHRKE
jgi:hypothetical protein